MTIFRLGYIALHLKKKLLISIDYFISVVSVRLGLRERDVKRTSMTASTTTARIMRHVSIKYRPTNANASQVSWENSVRQRYHSVPRSSTLVRTMHDVLITSLIIHASVSLDSKETIVQLTSMIVKITCAR